jgi:hypothetical protein
VIGQGIRGSGKDLVMFKLTAIYIRLAIPSDDTIAGSLLLKDSEIISQGATQLSNEPCAMGVVP